MIFRHLLNMQSHPTWVRGLKLGLGNLSGNKAVVAPYVGAWIETNGQIANSGNLVSHPTWVRGLKPLVRELGVCT